MTPYSPPWPLLQVFTTILSVALGCTYILYKFFSWKSMLTHFWSQKPQSTLFQNNHPAENNYKYYTNYTKLLFEDIREVTKQIELIRGYKTRGQEAHLSECYIHPGFFPKGSGKSCEKGWGGSWDQVEQRNQSWYSRWPNGWDLRVNNSREEGNCREVNPKV